MLVLSLDGMQREIERALDIEINGTQSELGLDSLQYLELCVALDGVGLFLPEEYYPHLRSLADIYEYFVTTRGHDR